MSYTQKSIFGYQNEFSYQTDTEPTLLVGRKHTQDLSEKIQKIPTKLTFLTKKSPAIAGLFNIVRRY